MESKTKIFLLKGGHLNMEERIDQGIWPHPPLTITELRNEIIEYLKTYKWFPHEWISKKNGEPIDDATVIEKIDKNKYIYRSRAASPYDLNKITMQTEKIFNSAEKAIEYYLREVLYLPGDLDGWKVVEEQ
ncbi:MAG: hypothetical protein KJ915_02140 [Candidatus Omnitrophica bacterium]|nr:hypothetical protein [Candidatus Omnitrophota bacterium]